MDVVEKEVQALEDAVQEEVQAAYAARGRKLQRESTKCVLACVEDTRSYPTHADVFSCSQECSVKLDEWQERVDHELRQLQASFDRCFSGCYGADSNSMDTNKMSACAKKCANTQMSFLRSAFDRIKYERA